MEKRHFQKVVLEIALLLIVFHVPYSKYKGMKICFYSRRYKIKITGVALLSFVQHSCRTRVVSVACLSHLSVLASCLTVSLVSHSCRTCLALVL